MKRAWNCLVQPAVIIGLTLLIAFPARADAQPAVKTEPFATLKSQPPATVARLKTVRTAPEQIGQVPGHFFWIRNGLQAAQDPVDGNVVFMNDDGRVLGRATLPAGFSIAEIYADAKEVRLLDAGRRQVAIPRTVDPASVGELAVMPAARTDGRTARLTRRSNEELLYQDQRRSGSALSIRALAGGTLAQAYEIGSGSGDNRYLVSEEIAGVKPALQVRIFVQRFDSAGRLTGAAHIPLDNIELVPRDFIAITGDGNVRVLLTDDSGVKIDEIEFSPPPKAGRRLNADETKSFGRMLRSTPVDSDITGEKKTLQRREGPATEVVSKLPPIGREAIMQNARAFLTINWVMQRENYAKAGVENVCAPERGKFWTRPHSFAETMVGTTIAAMPYRWGGDDTPATFRARMGLGALAGDICTCRSSKHNYCLVAGSAGVDCSGFVSRAWGIEKRGTTGLLDVSDSVDGIGDLKPGDAFNWSGRHIRLFAAPAPGAALAYTVLESSTRRDCEGVCERTYRPSELNGYQLIRYRGVNAAAVAEVKR